jgi:hypothetical protein
MALYANSGRSIKNFEFRGVNLNLEACQMAYDAGIGEKIESLTMHDCTVTWTNLNAMVAKSPNLRSLKFSKLKRSVTLGWMEEMRFDLSPTTTVTTEVTHLTWHDADTFLPLPLFNWLLKMCPKLTKLELAAGPQVPSLDADQWELPDEVDFIGFLQSQLGSQLTAIAIDEMNEPYSFISSMIKCASKLRLKELRLANSQVDVQELNNLPSVQQSLKVLDLQHMAVENVSMSII